MPCAVVKRVVVVSPLSGDVVRNTFYAELALLDSVFRDEAPYASHLLLPRVLDDTSARERELGMLIGQAWGKKAHLAAVYQDLGASSGMAADIGVYRTAGLPLELRRLRDECAIPDVRLIEIYDRFIPQRPDWDLTAEIKLLEDLFPRIFADNF